MTAHPYATPAGASANSILAVLGLLLEPGSVAEPRALNTSTKTVSGYVTDHAKLAAQAYCGVDRLPQSTSR